MSESLLKVDNDLSVVLCGEAGQGINTVELLLTKTLKRAGYNVFATKEYMSRIRGGSNSTSIRVSTRRVSAPVDRIDILIPLDRAQISRFGQRITDRTVVLGEREAYGDAVGVIDLPFAELASETGSKSYANTLAAGVVAGLLKVDLSLLVRSVEGLFSGKPEEVVSGNTEAAKRGHRIGSDLLASGKIAIEIGQSEAVAGELLINGAQAVAMGAIAGECDFISSYPMSPSTGVLTFLAQHHAEFGIAVEQAEDEIAAINMGLGAWYAGARALVTTSGGGFALMTEGMSLAGMIETPIVVHIAQRPGPATGLPTRTEQGDLMMTLYAGHGDFPRILLAPGTVEEAFYQTQLAFNLADRFQIPVIILTDQYLMDSYYNVPDLDLEKVRNRRFVVETDRDYRRYALTRDGISPRGIPGFGSGLVSVDSDEHDEEGRITEDLELRAKMVRKRLKKAETIKRHAIEPELIGPKDYSTLVVGWGSTYCVIREALQDVGIGGLSFLHIKQLHPLHHTVEGFLTKAGRVVSLEGNATGQLADLLRIQTGTEVNDRLVKFNGLAHTKEEVVAALGELG